MANGKTITVFKKADNMENNQLWEAVLKLQNENNELRQEIKKLWNLIL